MDTVHTIWIHSDAEKRYRATEHFANIVAEKGEDYGEWDACLMRVIQGLKMWAVKEDGGWWTVDGLEGENIFVPDCVVMRTEKGRH